jgi:hypothetical protein
MGTLGISSRIVTGPFGKKNQLFRNILFSNFSKNGLRVDEQGLTDSKKCASKSEQMQHRCLVRGAKNYSPGQIKLHKEKSAGKYTYRIIFRDGKVKRSTNDGARTSARLSIMRAAHTPHCVQSNYIQMDSARDKKH